MSITVIIGPMFSNKTKTLIHYLERKKLANELILLLKYKNDNRYCDIGENTIISHSIQENSYKFNPDYTWYIENINDIIIDKQNNNIRIKYNELTVENSENRKITIGIDEGQFMKNIESTNKWADLGINVFISALNGPSKLIELNNFDRIYPYAENIIHNKALCMLCKEEDAPFTKKISKSISIVDIGGENKYMSLCRKCFNKD